MSTIKVTLRRSGQRPIQFEGTSLAYADDHGPNSTRWTRADVFRTAGGKIVVGVANITAWEGEKNNYSAASFETVEQAVAFLEEHAPSLVESIAKELDVAEKVD